MPSGRQDTAVVSVEGTLGATSNRWVSWVMNLGENLRTSIIVTSCERHGVSNHQQFDCMSVVSTEELWSICFSMTTSSNGNISALLAICARNSPVTDEYSHIGQWRGALMFSLICAWLNGWVNNGEAGDLGRHITHYDVIVMSAKCFLGPKVYSMIKVSNYILWYTHFAGRKWNHGSLFTKTNNIKQQSASWSNWVKEQ